MVRSWSSTRLTIWSFICSFCCRISLGFFSYSVFNLCVKKTHTHQTLQTYFTVVNSKEFDERLQIKSFLLKRRHKERRHRFSSEATKNMSAALHSSLNCLPCFYDMQIPVPLIYQSAKDAYSQEVTKFNSFMEFCSNYQNATLLMTNLTVPSVKHCMRTQNFPTSTNIQSILPSACRHSLHGLFYGNIFPQSTGKHAMEKTCQRHGTRHL